MAKMDRPGVPFAGPEIYTVLPGPATQYSISTDGDGNAVVLRHSNVDRAENIGTLPYGVRARDNAARRELAGIRLKAMNKANAEFWAKQAQP
jgi:hypothetical protein